MKTLFLLSCLLISLTGCATTNTPLAGKVDDIRQPPAEAMGPCPRPEELKSDEFKAYIEKAVELAEWGNCSESRRKELEEWIRRGLKK